MYGERKGYEYDSRSTMSTRIYRRYEEKNEKNCVCVEKHEIYYDKR